MSGNYNNAELGPAGKFETLYLKIIPLLLIAASGFLVLSDWRSSHIFYLGILLISLLFVLLPLPPRDRHGAFLRILLVLTPILCCSVMTVITGKSLRDTAESMFTYAGLMNLLVISIICLVAYLITNRTKIAIVATTGFNLIYVLFNYSLIQFRGKPLIANDIFEWRTATMVADSYHLSLNSVAIHAVVLSLCWIAAALSLKSTGRGLALKGRLAFLIATVMAGGCMFSYVFLTDELSDNGLSVSGWKSQKSYKSNGYYISFLITFKQAKVKKPDGYSLDKVNEIASKYPSDKSIRSAGTNKKTPNVITIMNESFADMEYFGEIRTNREVIPFFNSLKKDSVRGTLHTSILGGHTAISEFEFLSGDTQHFLPLNSIPYSSIIRTHDTPSIAWNMRSMGYGGLTALHPGREKSYSRHIVYPLLGFDDYVYAQRMNEPGRVRSFVSDEADFDWLIADYEKYRKSERSKPWYYFNVTIQNHGGYEPEEKNPVPRDIRILDSELADTQVEEFLNLMKLSDDAFKDLVEYFKNVDEPTVILMYGDHQPKLPSGFYEVMDSRNGEQSEIEKQESQYRVPFIIWANYDIEEAEDVEMSVNYLSSYLTDMLGLPLTGYQKFLLDLKDKLPVITTMCYIDDDGKLSPSDTEDVKYPDALNDYRILQYNQISDYDNIPEDFFYLKE